MLIFKVFYVFFVVFKVIFSGFFMKCKEKKKRTQVFLPIRDTPC